MVLTGVVSSPFSRPPPPLSLPRPRAPPQGVWQLVPGKGEGFPEDFVPIVNFDEAINAKY